MATPITNNTTSLQDLLAKANALPEAGTKLPALTTPGAAADLREGKQLIDGDGNVVDGSMPTATQATPGITVSSGGLITASATQSAGYVTAGTKSATKQLTTQAAKTITPSKSTQTAVASGRYTTGAITVGAIPSQYIVPSGTKSITANGTHDVTGYASVNVAVPVEDLTAVLNEQDALITELETALEGKAAGGGSIPTCSVTFAASNIWSKCYGYSYTCVEDGKVTNKYVYGTTSGQTIGLLENLVCGSMVMIHTYSYSVGSATITGDAEHIGAFNIRLNTEYVNIFRMPLTAGDTAVIAIVAD